VEAREGFREVLRYQELGQKTAESNIREEMIESNDV
jgi:hypothetical protein